MKEIEERAKKFADEFATGDAALIVDIIHKVAEESYIKGATDQQNIDIEKACEWLKANTHSFRSDEFLEDFVKAMKGE